MFFIGDADTRAKIWKIDVRDKYADVRISTSEKKRDGSGYVNSNWFARFVGHAFESVKQCVEGDAVILRQVKISNEPYEKDGERHSSLRLAVFSFDRTDEDSTHVEHPKAKSNKSSKPASKQKLDEEDNEDDMPF